MSTHNPYQPPKEATGGSAALYAPSQHPAIVPFQSLQGLATAVKGLLAVVVVGKLAAIGATLYLIRTLGNGVDFSGTEVQISAGVLALIVVGVLLLTLVAGIVYLMWLHRAYQNLPALGVMKLDSSPGWAVGHYFIPILNLFRPYQTIVEIMRGSAPREEQLSGKVPTSLAGWWWTGWILAAVLGQASGVMVRGNEPDPVLLGYAAWVDVAMHVVSLLTALLAIAVVHRITTNQERKSGEKGFSPAQPYGFEPASASTFAPPPFAPGAAPGPNPFGDIR